MYKTVNKNKVIRVYIEDLSLHTGAPTVHLEDSTLCMASHPHKPIFILLIPIMYQISSGLHGVEIKLKTTKHRIV